MRFPIKNLHSVRVFGVTLAAATVVVPAVLAALLPGRSDALVLVALMLPFVTMGVLDAALPNDSLDQTHHRPSHS